MSRRRYVVAYDIREPRRLRKVHSTMKAFGYALQYSVFVCDLDDMEKIRMREAVERVMHLREEQVAERAMEQLLGKVEALEEAAAGS